MILNKNYFDKHMLFKFCITLLGNIINEYSDFQWPSCIKNVTNQRNIKTGEEVYFKMYYTLIFFTYDKFYVLCNKFCKQFLCLLNAKRIRSLLSIAFNVTLLFVFLN